MARRRCHPCKIGRCYANNEINYISTGRHISSGDLDFASPRVGVGRVHSISDTKSKPKIVFQKTKQKKKQKKLNKRSSDSASAIDKEKIVFILFCRKMKKLCIYMSKMIRKYFYIYELHTIITCDYCGYDEYSKWNRASESMRE